MLKVTIDRNRWLRGTTQRTNSKARFTAGNTRKHVVSSALHDEKSECMCCLGFVALACGVSKEDIAGIDRIERVEGNKIKEHLPKLFDQGEASLITDELVATNDSVSLKPQEKEHKIIDLGREAAIDFEFVTGKEQK